VGKRWNTYSETDFWGIEMNKKQVWDKDSTIQPGVTCIEATDEESVFVPGFWVIRSAGTDETKVDISKPFWYRIGEHIIEAGSEETARMIAEAHKIGKNPEKDYVPVYWSGKGPCRLMVLWRRLHGQGGSVWYMTKTGDLHKRTLEELPKELRDQLVALFDKEEE